MKGLPTAAFEAWGYGMTLIKTIGPNYNEAESIRESNAFKAAIPMPAASEIITAAIWEYGFAEFMKTV